MGKQAIGAIAFNQLKCIGTLSYLFVYPQQPMFKTNTINLVGYDKLPAGQNATELLGIRHRRRILGKSAAVFLSMYLLADFIQGSLDCGYGRCQVF